MFTVGNGDRYIGRHSIDIAFDSRSTVDRLSIDSQSTIDREVVDSRSSVDRYSVDRAINHRRGKVDISSTHLDRISVNCRYTSTEYRPTVGDMSVNCRWHIGQLSVAYQSCVNLAGESNGFPQ